MLKKSNIIGIFDLETTSMEKKTREFLKINEKNKNIINYCSEIPKSFIVCKENNNNRVYISQISSQTIIKRAERNVEFGTEG